MNKSISKIYIGTDHRGVGLKLYLTEMLSAAGYDVVNMGTDNPAEKIDFPIIAAAVAGAMKEDPASRGILICGVGAGMVIAANRYRHIRATRCELPERARDDRFHDDVNVIVFAADDVELETAMLCTMTFLESPFEALERRVRRIEEIS
jgi:ribose 5-phosphate isomerase B